MRVESARRARGRAAWNRPVLWPVAAALLLLAAGAAPAVIAYRRRERTVRR